MTDQQPKGRGGFRYMSPERVREIAAMGGRAVQRGERSFSKDRDLAKSAGAKGGRAYRPSEHKS